MRAPARRRMIVPGPARRHVDLEAHLAAQALAGGGFSERHRFGFLLFGFFLFGKHVRSSRFVIASAAKQSMAPRRKNGLLRCARNDGSGSRLRQLVVYGVVGIAGDVATIEGLAAISERNSVFIRVCNRFGLPVKGLSGACFDAKRYSVRLKRLYSAIGELNSSM